MATKKKMSKKRRRQKRRRAIFLEILFLLVVLVGVYAFSIINKIHFEKLDKKDAGINKDISDDTIETLEGYTNIALFGLDNRTIGDYSSGNSDTIMIASIDNQTKEVKLVSVFRDTILNVGDDKYKKANYAFGHGGAAKAVAMLNSNLDLDITDYMCIDWAALVEIIDDLGGIDLDVKEKEAEQLNLYLEEVDMVTGNHTEKLKGYGEVHLDGTQALCYARIRKHVGSDYARASRQRIVLQAMMEKAKAADPLTLVEICNDTFDDISTTLKLTELIGMAKDIKKYQIVETTGFPFTLTTRDIQGAGDSVVPCTLKNNVTQLHEFLFGETDYVLSSTVKNFDAKIINVTGVSSDEDAVDISKYNNTAGANGSNFTD